MPADMAPASTAGSNPELKRELSALDVAMMGLASALGTGLFLGSRGVIEIAGLAGILSYLIATVLASIVVYAMGEITVAYPHAGGFGEAAKHFVGPHVGFMARWNVAIASCIAVGVEITAAAGYVTLLVPHVHIVVPIVIISALILVLSLTAIRLYGIMQTSMTFIKISAVVLFVMAAAWLIFMGTGEVGGRSIGLSVVTSEPFAPNGMSGLLLGASLAIFSFGGIESSSVAAGECRDPAVAVPKATRLMLVMIFISGLGSLSAILSLLPVKDLLASDPHQSPFVTVLRELGVAEAGNIMDMLLILAALSSALGLMYAASRMLLSLANERLAPGAFARVRSDGVPQFAVMGAASGMLIALVVSLLSPDNAFIILLGILVFGVVVTWSMVLLTHVFMNLYHRTDETASTMRLPGGAWTSGIVLLIMPVIAISLWWIPGQKFALLVGAPYFVALFVAAKIVSKLK